MWDWLRSLFGDVQQKGVAPTPRHQQATPSQHKRFTGLGQYAFEPANPVILENSALWQYEDALKASLYVCVPKTPEVGRQVAIICLGGLPSAAFYLTPVMFRGDLSVKPSVLDLFCQMGEATAREGYQCWPLIPSQPFPELVALDNQGLFLWSYFCSLTQKKHFSSAKLPKAVTNVLDATSISRSLERLVALGMISEEKGGFTIAASDLARAAQLHFAELGAVAKFITLAEGSTYMVWRNIGEAESLGMKLRRERLSGNVEPICPACTTTLKRKQFVPLSPESLLPFHFECYASFRPE